jgi:hypothetical protein
MPTYIRVAWECRQVPTHLLRPPDTAAAANSRNAALARLHAPQAPVSLAILHCSGVGPFHLNADGRMWNIHSG